MTTGRAQFQPKIPVRFFVVVALITAVAVVIAGCTHSSSGSARGSRTTPGTQATLTAAPAGATIAAVKGALPTLGSTESITATFDAQPSGALPSPVTVTLPMSAPVPTGTDVFVQAAEAVNEQPMLLPAAVTADGQHLTFTTNHFTLFAGVSLDIAGALRGFRRQFIDDLTGNATASADKPSCKQENEARQDGYSVDSNHKDTVYWCLGLEGGHRILTVVNNRRYPLLLDHPGVTVLRQDSLNPTAWSALSHFASGSTSVLAPRGSITYIADLQPGLTGLVRTQFDGFGQSMYALQMGVQEAADLLDRFGMGPANADSAKKVTQAFTTLVSTEKCGAAMLKHDPVALFDSCFDANALVDALGVKALALVMSMIVLPVCEYFRSQFNALGDQFNGRDTYTVAVMRSAAAAGTGGDTGSSGSGGGTGNSSSGSSSSSSSSSGSGGGTGSSSSSSSSGSGSGGGSSSSSSSGSGGGTGSSSSSSSGSGGGTGTGTGTGSGGGGGGGDTGNSSGSSGGGTGGDTGSSSSEAAETAGSVAHTWTNYTNAGGSEGPTIAAGQSVAISCKLSGFAVANGNTWWYRIASAPWNNAFYVSSDAFYNNGHTSGSLSGTPYVDPAVPNC